MAINQTVSELLSVDHVTIFNPNEFYIEMVESYFRGYLGFFFFYDFSICREGTFISI